MYTVTWVHLPSPRTHVPVDTSSQRLSVGFSSSLNSARGLQTRAHVPQGPAQRVLHAPQYEMRCQTRQSRYSQRPADRSTEQPGKNYSTCPPVPCLRTISEHFVLEKVGFESSTTAGPRIVRFRGNADEML